MWTTELVSILFEGLRGSIQGRIVLALQSKMGLNWVGQKRGHFELVYGGKLGNMFGKVMILKH
jgi:hypothetical protein